MSYLHPYIVIPIRVILSISFIIKLWVLYYWNQNEHLFYLCLFIFVISNLISITLWFNKNKHIEFLNFQKKILDLQPDKIIGTSKQTHIQLINQLIHKISPDIRNIYEQKKTFWFKFSLNQVITLLIFAIFSYLHLLVFLACYITIGIIMSVLWHWIIIQKQKPTRDKIDQFFESIFTHS